MDISSIRIAIPTFPPLVTPTEGGSAWQVLQPGLELQKLPTDAITVLRIDPAQVSMQVGYRPEAPLTVSEWLTATAALAIVNGGYFEATNVASALTIVDGTATGQSYEGFGGMLSISEVKNVELRSLADNPYTPGEPIQQALQSFPRLVWDGEALPFPQDNGRKARRTVVATDRSGRVLLIIVDAPRWTLTELGSWLDDSNLDIDRALNLDGGPSTGLALRSGSSSLLIDSYTPVPQVLIIAPQ